MPNIVKLKRSAVSAAVPTTSQLELGEVAINTFDGRLFIKKNDGAESIVQVGTVTNLTGHVTSVGNAAVLGSFTSLQLLTALTDETGTGANVFATSPTFVTPLLGTPTSGVMTNVTGLPIDAGTTGTLTVARGGTGAATLTANNVLLGNGTSALQVVAPGTSGNVLTSNGTTWASSAPAAGGVTYTTTKTANYTAVANDGVLTNTTGGVFTVTLPASPTNGQQVIIADAAGTWGTNNLTVGRNGLNIADLAENLVCDINGVSVQFVYNSSGTPTWEVFAQIGGIGGTSLTSAAIGVTVQGYDADLQAIGALAGTSGLLQKTAADTWTLNTTTYAPLASPTFSGTVSDALGKLRAIPQTGAAKTASYTLTTADVGTFVNVGTGGSVTIPNSTFAVGDAVSIYNATTGAITITFSTTTAYIGGTDTNKTSVTLATRGVATILFISGTVCVVTGNVT